jgi:hypothetical protein
VVEDELEGDGLPLDEHTGTCQDRYYCVDAQQCVVKGAQPADHIVGCSICPAVPLRLEGVDELSEACRRSRINHGSIRLLAVLHGGKCYMH